MPTIHDHAYFLEQRCRLMNHYPVRRGNGTYVLCWLQQTLRGTNNPVLDAAIALGNNLALPVVVYHGIAHHYPHASDRLHSFILEASRSLERDVIERGLRFIRVIERPDRVGQGLVYELSSHAAAVVIDDHAAFIGRWQLESVAAKLQRPVIAVDGSRLVPEAAIGVSCTTTPAFRARVNEVRPIWLDEPMNLSPAVQTITGDLVAEHDEVGPIGSGEIARWVDCCDIDHSLPPVSWCKGDRDSALAQLVWAATDVIPRYATQRNNASIRGVSYLSPYLHFGVLGPHDVARIASEVESPRDVWKFLDEMLVWREFFHHIALHSAAPDAFTNVSRWARESLAAHAVDDRERLYELSDLVHGRTSDETWNAAQRQFLVEGWMHNNLRMYWGKRLISWTTSPEVAWQTACYLNDRLSLDGRDPATYGNLRWCFGGGRPAREIPVYGRVSRKSDAAMRRRSGVAEWLAKQAVQSTPAVHVPDEIPIFKRPPASGIKTRAHSCALNGDVMT